MCVIPACLELLQKPKRLAMLTICFSLLVLSVLTHWSGTLLHTSVITSELAGYALVIKANLIIHNIDLSLKRDVLVARHCLLPSANAISASSGPALVNQLMLIYI